MPLAQVLARFAEYGDAVVGRFGAKDTGARYPNVRTVVKPLLGLFHNAPGGRRWRHVLDSELLKKPETVSQVLQVREPACGLHGCSSHVLGWQLPV